MKQQKGIKRQTLYFLAQCNRVLQFQKIFFYKNVISDKTAEAHSFGRKMTCL